MRVEQEESESCRRKRGERHKAVTPAHNMETLASWTFDEAMPEATDGCIVEPDGYCEHGHASWLLRLGLT